MIYKFILFYLMLVLSVSCNSSKKEVLLVSNSETLSAALKVAKPGDEIVMANGIWKDIQIKFSGQGTKKLPITLRAETAGQVFIEGKSDLKLAGKNLVVSGLHFRNGATPSKSVIAFKINEEEIAFSSRVTNCIIESFTQSNRARPDHWVEFYGRYNQLDHCYIKGKSNQGPTIRVYLNGNEHIKNYHSINNNHFGPRPRKGGPKAETMQIGDSFTSMTPSHVQVFDNFFEKCNGEVEIISSKSNFNEFRNNIFYKCEGSLVLRHGNYATVDGNIFIGDGQSSNIGGIRVINTGHWITNNYFYGLKGNEFRSPLAVMNGIPKSPLNRYNQVTDVVVAYNSWVNCEQPWQFSVGANMDNSDVLPEQEIRSARPKRVILANNIIYNDEEGAMQPVKAYDTIDGILFKNNLISQRISENKYALDLQLVNFSADKKSDWFVELILQEGRPSYNYNGFDFDNIKNDLFGSLRKGNENAGAVLSGAVKSQYSIDKNKYGVDWYRAQEKNKAGTVHQVTDSSELHKKLRSVASGDVIEMTEGIYTLDHSLEIDKKITIKSKNGISKTIIKSSENLNGPVFLILPNCDLTMENLIVEGNSENNAFETLPSGMSKSYDLFLRGSTITNFKTFLKAFKGSFADTILLSNVIVKNMKNGILLAEEKDDKGDYNAEFVLIDSCEWKNIESDVINYYRGGYDESTIGGNLKVINSKFSFCGSKEKQNILIKTRGIVNVDISGNFFENNPVSYISVLWGQKNNVHSNNEIINSGEFLVEQRLKQKLMY